MERSFVELVEAARGEERAWRETCRVVFMVTYGLGLRRGEILGLRWRSVRLADPEGASLRVEETLVRGAPDTPKSAASARTLSLASRISDELFRHRAASSFDGDDERVFVSPQSGAALDPKRYAATLRAALALGGVEGYVRPFHDGRHSSITNDAAAGNDPLAIMSRAGHSNFSTTQIYIDLSGERFREAAVNLEQRLWGGPVEETVEKEPIRRLERQRKSASSR